MVAPLKWGRRSLWGISSLPVKSCKMLHCLLYFQTEGYFSIPVVVWKYLKALGNIPVIWALYQLMWIGRDSTQPSIGLANCPGTLSSTRRWAVSQGSQFCWTLGVASCMVWCNPTSLCCERSQMLPGTTRRWAMWETSLGVDGNGVQPGWYELCWLSLGSESRLWPVFDPSRGVAIEFGQHMSCHSRPKIFITFWRLPAKIGQP